MIEKIPLNISPEGPVNTLTREVILYNAINPFSEGIEM